MKRSACLVLIYGLLILVGGIFGHIKAASKASLITGILFSAALFISSFAIFRKKIAGQYVALLLVFILDGFFTYRFIHTEKFFPAGLMSLISLATMILLALFLRQSLQQLRSQR